MCFVVFVTFKDAQGKVCTSIECCEKVFAMILIVLFYLIFFAHISDHQILLQLDQDNQIKSKMQFINDHFIFQGSKLSKPTWPRVRK